MKQNISIQEDYKIIYYFLFMLAKKYIRRFSRTTRICSWKSNEMSDKNIEKVIKSDNVFTPTFVNYYTLPDKNFNGCRLIKNNIFIPKKSNKSIYLLHTKSMEKTDLKTDLTLNNCLFGSVEC